MTTETLRYVTARRNHDGTVRWYWQRKGFPVHRLPGEAVARFTEAARLNREADKPGDIPARAYGSVGWLIDDYRKTPKFEALSDETKRNYDRWLAKTEEYWGHLPIASISRRDVVDAVEGLGGGPSTKKHLAAVLANLFERARYRGLIQVNHAHKLRLKGSRRRTEVWTDADAAAFLDACAKEREGDAARLAFQLLLYTAQRPGDILQKGKDGGIAWNAYNGDTITLRQEKTGKLIEVPCHSRLRVALDAARAGAQSTLIVAKRNGRPLSYQGWKAIFNRVKASVGLEHLQARDLRRTAVVNMAEAGATVPEISAVTGHSVERTQAIIEHYLPRSVAMARAGIHKLETKESNVSP